MRAPAWIGIAIFAWLSSDLAAAPFWLDSGELTAAGAEMAIMHPPGAPGLSSVFHLLTAFPVATLAFRVALANAMLAAFVATLVAILLARRGAHVGLQAAAVAWCFAGLTMARQARVVEIYAYGCALLLVWLACVDPQRPRPRTWHVLAAGVCAGLAALGFADLRLAMLVLLPLWFRGLIQRTPRDLPAAMLGLALSTVVGLTLPLQSARAPLCDWGQPDTFWRWWDHLQATSIRLAYQQQIGWGSLGQMQAQLMRFVERLLGDMGAIGLVVVGIGTMLRLRQSASRAPACTLLFLFAVEIVYAVVINPMGEVDRQSAIAFYPVAALALAWVVLDASEVMMRRWPTWSSRNLQLTGAVLVGGLALQPALSTREDGAATRSWFAHWWVQDALARLPPGALVLTQSDDFAAHSLAGQWLEGWRPDLVVLPAQHLYRRTPKLAAGRPRLAMAWNLAHRGHDEASRIRQIVAHWPGTVALEQPATGIFSAIPWRHGGDAPLGRSDQTQWPEFTAWLAPRLRWTQHDEDRLRIARAWLPVVKLSVQRGDKVALLAGQSQLVTILRDVAPGHVPSMNSLAALWDRLGLVEQAQALGQQALQLDPSSSAARLNLARMWSRQPHQLDQAFDVVWAGLTLNGDDPTLLREAQRLCGLPGVRADAHADACMHVQAKAH